MNLPIEHICLIILGCIIVLYTILYYATKKKILIEYELENYSALNATDYTYVLTFEVTALWGFHKEICRIQYNIPGHHLIVDYTNHWNKIIQTKKPI